MQIDIKDSSGQPRLTVHVDTDRPPTVVHADDGRGPAVTLDWDRALDDSGHLRHCPVCGCGAMYVRRTVPTVIGFAAVCAGATLTLALLRSTAAWWAAGVLLLVVLIDVAIRVFSRRRLVCYGCGAEFRGVPIPRGTKGWDSGVAERFGRSKPSHRRGGRRSVPPADQPAPSAESSSATSNTTT